MKSARIFIPTLFVLGLALNALASEPPKRVSCMLNKSYSLVITLDRHQGEIEGAVLHTQNFLGQDVQQVAILEGSRLQVIEYGDTLILSQDFGRSGFVLVHLERSREGELQGFVNVNLLGNPAFEGRGAISGLYCH